MKKQFFLIGFLAISMMSFAQTAANIIVAHAGTSVAYTSLPAAIAGAADGATVYIPGGIHTFSSDITISKQLHFKGDGVYTLAVANGLVPQISGNKMILKRAAHGSTFEGVYFTNVLELKHETTDLSGNFHITINRCKFDNNIIASGGNSVIGNVIIMVNQSIVSGFSLSTAIEALYVNNSIILGSSIYNVDQGLIKNSISLDAYYLQLSSTSNLLIANSIIYGGVSQGTNNTVSNCLIRTGRTISSEIASTNNLWQDWADIFVNAPSGSYNQGNDYHLKPGCLGIGAGNDGLDVGIYGGTNPWKDQLIPVSPNVYHKSVSSSNDSEGKINATYKVKAQTN